jgi:cob(I)alamin adenosyltransferase
MVNLTRIYTKTGDDGTTSLGDLSRVPKTDSRIEAYATVDEANSFIGVAMSSMVSTRLISVMRNIQNHLFDVGADLSTPVVQDPKITPLRITEEQIEYLEKWIDSLNSKLEPLRSFVLPSGTKASADLHVARTVVRRAERAVWRALEDRWGGVNPLTAKYLNRLSDLLFVIARYENRTSGDILWEPGAKVKDTEATHLSDDTV